MSTGTARLPGGSYRVACGGGLRALLLLRGAAVPGAGTDAGSEAGL